jgi:hypothetical protein
LLSIDFNRPHSQPFDDYESYQDAEYGNHWQNQYQRTGTPNEFEHERRPSPFYNNSHAPPVQSRSQLSQIPNEYQQQQMYTREPLRQQPIQQQPQVPTAHARVNTIHTTHPPAAVGHHQILVRDPFYRPQFQPSQYPEYQNGYQPQFAAPTFVGHPAVQHVGSNARRHEDNLRNLRSPMLEEFRSAKNKKYELKVSKSSMWDLIARTFSVTLSNLAGINTVLDLFNRNSRLRPARTN